MLFETIKNEHYYRHDDNSLHAGIKSEREMVFQIIERLVAIICYNEGLLCNIKSSALSYKGEILCGDISGNQLEVAYAGMGNWSSYDVIPYFTNYLNIPLEIKNQLNLINRYHRFCVEPRWNSEDFCLEYQGTNEKNDHLELFYNFLDSYCIFSYWFINEYIVAELDEKTKEKFLNDIKTIKNIIERIKNRSFVYDKDGSSDELAKAKKYIEYLEDKLNQIELDKKLPETISNSNKAMFEMLEKISQKVDTVLDKQDTIITKIEDLTDYILREQDNIQKSLDEAIKNRNGVEIEKIVDSFSNRVTAKIMDEVEHNESDKKYEEEKLKLELMFGNENWDKLEDNSKDFLITGKLLYDKMASTSKLDFSGVCLLITKAVDNELHKYLYSKFKDYLQKKYPFEKNSSKWPSFFVKSNYYGNSLISDNDFTLGSVLYFCCNDKNAAITDKNILIDYCEQELFKDTSKKSIDKNLRFISDCAEKIRVDYRNPSAHINAITKVKADECMDYVINTTKVLISLMELFR